MTQPKKKSPSSKSSKETVRGSSRRERLLQKLQESVSINIRAKMPQRNLIDQAAASLGRSRSEFMLDAACRQAEEVLLDQAFFSVDSETFNQLALLVDKPLPTTDKLRRLLKTKAPWEK